jgi:hypothetical protein
MGVCVSDWRGAEYVKRRNAMVARANVDPDARCEMPGCGLRLDEHPNTKTGKRPEWTADHVRPGDPHSPLRLAASSCNYSAGARHGNTMRVKVVGTVPYGMSR